MPQRLKFDRAQARRLRAEGLTLVEIGQRLGVSAPAICTGLRRLSVHHEFLRSLSPDELTDYRTFIKAGVGRDDARRAVRKEYE